MAKPRTFEATCPECRSVYLVSRIRTAVVFVGEEPPGIGCDYCGALLRRSPHGYAYVACVLVRQGTAP